MKIQSAMLALSLTAFMVGCQSVDTALLTQSGIQAFQAVSLNNDQIKGLSDQSCQQIDNKAKIAPADSKYSQRLAKIATALGDNINDTSTNYKVYLIKDVNAWAMANGCIRVYSGLMDMMTDNEIEGVLGHEMGHVALGHTRKAMQIALAAAATRTATRSMGGTIASLSQSQLGDLAEKLINAQFSQTQEKQADDYSFDFLKKRGISPYGLVTGFEKLKTLDDRHQISLFNSHPASEARAQHIRDRIAAEK